MAATVCQIQLLTDPYRIVRPQRATNPPSVHPATQVYHQRRLLSPAADSPCSFSPATQRFQERKDCHEMRMQCRWNSAREQQQQQHSLSGNIPTAPHNSETYRSQMELSRKQQTTQRWRIYRVKIGWRHWGNDENVSSLSPINCLCKSLIHDTPDAP